MKHLGMWTGAIEERFTNIIKDMKERMSDTEDTVEEMDALVKERR